MTLSVNTRSSEVADVGLGFFQMFDSIIQCLGVQTSLPSTRILKYFKFLVALNHSERSVFYAAL